MFQPSGCEIARICHVVKTYCGLSSFEIRLDISLGSRLAILSKILHEAPSDPPFTCLVTIEDLLSKHQVSSRQFSFDTFGTQHRIQVPRISFR